MARGADHRDGVADEERPPPGEVVGELLLRHLPLQPPDSNTPSHVPIELLARLAVVRQPISQCSLVRKPAL